MIFISINYLHYLNLFIVDCFSIVDLLFLVPSPHPIQLLCYSYREQKNLKENRFIGKIQNSSKEELNNEVLGLEPIAS